MPGITSRRLVLATASASAGAVHFAMIPSHAQDSVLLAVGFAVVAWFQLGGAFVLAWRPTRRALLLSAAANLATIGAWLVSRTVGLPFGLHAGGPEAVGSTDAFATAAAGVVVLGALWSILVHDRGRATSRARLVATGLVPSIVLVLTASTVLAVPSGSTQHLHADGDIATHDHGAPCDAVATASEQATADELVADTRATVAQWSDFDDAVAAGFTHITPESQLVVHYARLDWIDDGRVLEPSRPESLLYAFPARGEPVLLGAMYLTEAGGAQPEIAGCLVRWHAHTNLCVAPGVGMVSVVGDGGSCPPGSVNDETRAMVHVWSYDTSAGPFAELDAVDPDEMRDAVLAARVS